MSSNWLRRRRKTLRSERRNSAAIWMTTAGTGFTAGGANGLRPDVKPITRAYAVARRKSISVKTAGSCSLKDGMGRAVTNCPGRLKTCLKRNGNALTDNDWHKHSYACMAVREHLSNFVFHSRCKTFPYCKLSIRPGYGRWDILSLYCQVNTDGATEPVCPVTSFFAIRACRVALFGHF